jgi:hypothetical protein
MKFLLRIVVGIAIAVGLFYAWYVGARPVALWAYDHGASRSLGTKTISEIGWNGTYMVLNGETLDFDNSRDVPVRTGVPMMTLSVDAAHRLIASANGKSIMLGVGKGTLIQPGDPEPQPAFHGEPGDKITVARTQGRLSWPNWFETNYMTGNVAIWKRFVTIRWLWNKSSGASLEVLWRFEQYYFPQDGWVDADMMGATDCGVVKVHITPASR